MKLTKFSSVALLTLGLSVLVYADSCANITPAYVSTGGTCMTPIWPLLPYCTDDGDTQSSGYCSGTATTICRDNDQLYNLQIYTPKDGSDCNAGCAKQQIVPKYINNPLNMGTCVYH